MVKPRSIVAAVCLAAAQATLAADPAGAKEPLPGAKWMAHCTSNLKSEHPRQRRAVNIYCRCMAWVGDETEMLTWTQSDLEHFYPPVHLQCHERAGFGPG